MYIHTHTYVYIYIDIYVHTYIHTYRHACLHAYIHACIHTYTTSAHIHTRLQRLHDATWVRKCPADQEASGHTPVTYSAYVSIRQHTSA